MTAPLQATDQARRQGSPHTFARNAAALYGAETFGRLALAGLAIFVARKLGSGALGTLVFASSLAGITKVAGDFGLGVYLVRALSRSQERVAETASSVFAARALLTVAIAVPALGYAAAAAGEGPALAATAFALGYTLLLVYAETVFALYRVSERMEVEARARFGLSLTYTAGGAAVLALGGGVAALLAWSCVAAIALDLYARLLARRLGVGLRFALKPRSQLRAVVVASLPFGVLAILTTISFRIDSLMIELLRGSRALGLYGAAYSGMEFLLILPAMATAALFPFAARQIDVDPAGVVSLVGGALRLLWVIAFPLAAALGLLGGTVLGALFGGQFRSAQTVLTLLATTLIPLYASALTSLVISASRRPQVNTAIAAGMVGANVALNLALIPALGINGAGLATLLTESAGLIAGALYIRRTHGTAPWLGAALRPALAAGAMAGTIAALGSPLAAIPLYALVYLVVLAAIGGLRRSDLQLLGSLVRSLPAAVGGGG